MYQFDSLDVCDMLSMEYAAAFPCTCVWYDDSVMDVLAEVLDSDEFVMY